MLWATQSLSSLALQRSRNGTDAKAASISELSEIKKPSNFQKNCRSHLCHICLLCVFGNFLDALTPMQKMSLLKVFKESHGNFPNSATRIVRRWRWKWLMTECLSNKCSTLCNANSFWSVWSPRSKALLCFVISNLSNIFLKVNFFLVRKNSDIFWCSQAGLALPRWIFSKLCCFLCSGSYISWLLRCLPLCPGSIYYALPRVPQ